MALNLMIFHTNLIRKNSNLDFSKNISKEKQAENRNETGSNLSLGTRLVRVIVQFQVMKILLKK